MIRSELSSVHVCPVRCHQYERAGPVVFDDVATEDP